MESLLMTHCDDCGKVSLIKSFPHQGALRKRQTSHPAEYINFLYVTKRTRSKMIRTVTEQIKMHPVRFVTSHFLEENSPDCIDKEAADPCDSTLEHDDDSGTGAGFQLVPDGGDGCDTRRIEQCEYQKCYCRKRRENL